MWQEEFLGWMDECWAELVENYLEEVHERLHRKYLIDSKFGSVVKELGGILNESCQYVDTQCRKLFLICNVKYDNMVHTIKYQMLFYMYLLKPKLLNPS